MSKDRYLSTLTLTRYFPVNVLMNNIKISEDWYYHNNRIYSALGIELQDISIFLLIVLYHNNLITRQQFCTYCNKYDHDSTFYSKNELTRVVNTYCSPITKNWYNDASFTYILYDSCSQANCKWEDISVEQFLQYLNLGFNRNRNWCINHLAFKYIKPLLHSTESKATLALNRLLPEIHILSYEEADDKYNLADGYCCQDCDGCKGEYKRSRYKYNFAPDYDKISEQIKTILLSWKTHNKNPTDKLMLNF